jgi:hypothetical protein
MAAISAAICRARSRWEPSFRSESTAEATAAGSRSSGSRRRATREEHRPPLLDGQRQVLGSVGREPRRPLVELEEPEAT